MALFRNFREERIKVPKMTKSERPKSDKSGLFDLRITDIVGVHNASERFPSLFHDSDTGKNTSIFNGYLLCWRHNVTHTPLTALAVMAGLGDCVDCGFGQKHSSVGGSRLNFRDAATLQRLKEFAIKEGLIR